MLNMQALRKRYPYHIPCCVNVPNSSILKLLVPANASVAFLMLEVRRKWPESLSEADALFCFYNNRICMGNTLLRTLDNHKPDPLDFVVRQENTFG